MGGLRRSRSRGRETEGFEAANDLVAREKGIGSLRKQASAPETLLDSSFAAEYKRSTSKKASGIPMKILIDEEVSKEVNIRHPSPGIIGRLMGLDSLPPSLGVHSQQKYVGSHSQRASPVSSQDNYCFPGDVSRRRSMDESPEFKDVFEVAEATRMITHRSPKSKRVNVCSRVANTDNADMDFIRQKFMDAKRLSTDESLQRSKEFNDALEALVSNKDLLLEFLQDRDPMFTKDLHDLNCSPSSQANRITILKPSKRNKFIDAEIISPLELDVERCTHMPKEVKRSSRKHSTNLSGQSFNEDCCALKQKLSRSGYQECIDERIHPTRIVVLKPSLMKAQNIEGAFPLTDEIFHSGYRRPKACQNVGTQGPFTEECMCQMFSSNSENLGSKAKGSREIAREITKQMRRTARGGGSGKREVGMVHRDERPHILSSLSKFNASEAFHKSSEVHDDWAHSFSHSPSYAAETSVGKEARKRLSDRWKMTQQYKELAPDAQGPSTLGEMLSLSDRDASNVVPCSMACQKCSNEESHKDGTLGACSCTPVISSNDGWKDGALSNLTRSKSLPSSSIIWGSPKSSSRKRNGRRSEFSMLKDVLKVGPYDSEDRCYGRQRRSVIRSSTYRGDDADVTLQGEEENMLTEREIHVNSEGPRNTITMPNTSEWRPVHPAHSGHTLNGEYYPDNGSAVPPSQDVVLPPAPEKHQMQHESELAVEDEELDVPSLDDLVIQVEGIDHHESVPNPSLCNPMESESPVSAKDDEQPSPVSVLESSLENEDAYSGGFEKISADLQELRMQLRLLKMETTDNAEETELLMVSDDESGAQDQSLSGTGDTCHAYRDEEERDFSYLIDMLFDLGFHAGNQDELLGACYLLDCPVGPDVYNRLEKKYSKLILWSRSERKLLFDLVNSVLADIVASWMDHGSQGMLNRCRSKWDRDGFVEEVWRRVVWQRRELECAQEEIAMNAGWSVLEDGNSMVGDEIGSMLNEDLLEELIADFLL